MRRVIAALLWGVLLGSLLPVERWLPSTPETAAPKTPTSRPCTLTHKAGPRRQGAQPAPAREEPSHETWIEHTQEWARQSKAAAQSPELGAPAEIDCESSPCLSAWLIPGVDITDVIQDQIWLTLAFDGQGVHTDAQLLQRPAGAVIILNEEAEDLDPNDLVFRSRVMDLADRVGEPPDDPDTGTDSPDTGSD